MRGGLTRQGYTIIEVMIFLAVSGVMFLIAAAFINGKQGQVEFKQSMNNINNQVQQVINSVTNGYYPSSSSFNCYSTATGLTITAGGANSAGQGAHGGTNSSGQGGCVFMGQVIQFGDGLGGTAPTDASKSNYSIYTVAGSQYGNGGTGPDLPSCFSTAQAPNCKVALPTAVYSDPSVSGGVDLTQNDNLQSGLMVTRMYVSPPGGGAGSVQDINGIGFFGSFSSLTGGGDLASGSQSLQVVIYGVNTSVNSANNTQNMMASVSSNEISAPSSYGPTTVLSQAADITVCFTDGGGHFGTLTIGNTNGQRLSTNIQISNGVVGACPSS